MSSSQGLPDRLKALAKIAGSQNKLAAIVGVTSPAVSGWIHGAMPYESNLDQISEKTGVSGEWLRTGFGDAELELQKFRDRRAQMSDENGNFVREDRTPAVYGTGGLVARKIPVISMAQAGQLSVWEDVDDPEGVEMFAVKDPRAIAVRIRGDSMAPDYKEGTIAILYPSVPPRTDNLVVVRLKDGSVLFKRLHIAGDQYHLLSINPKYSTITVTADQIERMLTVGKTERDEL